jgi:hypothetical protein
MKCVVQIVVVADGICVEGCEDDVSEARRHDLKLNAVPDNVDGLANIKYAFEVVNVTVVKWLSVGEMDSFESGLFYR